MRKHSHRPDMSDTGGLAHATHLPPPQLTSAHIAFKRDPSELNENMS